MAKSRRAVVRKKDFSFTEVVETFKVLMDFGFTPGHFREIRSRLGLLARILISADQEAAIHHPLTPLSFSQLVGCVDVLTKKKGRVVYLSASQQYGTVYLTLRSPYRCEEDGFPAEDNERVSRSLVAHLNGGVHIQNIHEAFMEDAGYHLNEVTDFLRARDSDVKVFAVWHD